MAFEESELPPKAFEDAIGEFVQGLCTARDRLVDAMLGLSKNEWHRSREILRGWIARGNDNAKAYQRVIDEVEYQRLPQPVNDNRF